MVNAPYLRAGHTQPLALLASKRGDRSWREVAGGRAFGVCVCLICRELVASAHDLCRSWGAKCWPGVWLCEGTRDLAVCRYKGFGCV